MTASREIYSGCRLGTEDPTLEASSWQRFSAQFWHGLPTPVEMRDKDHRGSRVGAALNTTASFASFGLLHGSSFFQVGALLVACQCCTLREKSCYIL